MTESLAMQSAEVAVSGPVAIVWQLTNVDLVGDRCVSAINEAVISTLVGFLVEGRGLDDRTLTTEKWVKGNCRRNGCYRGGTLYKVPSA